MPDDDTILIGRVGRAHGIRGQVIVHSDTDFPEQRFREGAELLLVKSGEPSTRRRIGTVRFQQGRPVIGFEGIASMSEAEQLAGVELRLPSSELGPLPERTFHHHELIGCEVRDTGDALIGLVRAVEGPMERSRLVVQSPRGEVLIPLADGICLSIDPAARRILVDLPEGLVELNLPSRPK
ncbi:MAG: ribosome maturation factor RimM [Vicinamibacterales bacterium]